jgi:Type VI secretion system (T6SS), amidase effector protein 4
VGILAARAVADYYEKYLKYDRYYKQHFAQQNPHVSGTKPCRDAQAHNQCAVRLSCALEGLSPGFLDDFDPANRVHRGRPTCAELPPHVLGAAELGRYMSTKWGMPYSVPKQLDMRETLSGRPGLLWFVSCYEVDTQSHIRSDHVDFWTGWHYMNEVFHEPAGKNGSASEDLFMTSHGGVRFFPLIP